jgi:acyl-coenzyme A synthetase/AMP-(fatty) acid ligase
MDMLAYAILLPGVIALVVIAGRLGFHQRLALLAFHRLRIWTAVDFAARRYGDRVIFELEEPLGWRMPQEAEADGRYWSARRVQRTAARLAAIFKNELSLGRADRAAIVKRDDFDVFLFSLAITRAGGVSVPVNGGLAPESARQYLTHVGARVVVCDNATLDLLCSTGAPPAPVRHIVVTDGRPGDRTRASWIRAAGHGVACHELESLLAGTDRELPAAPRGGDDPLYLVHTSGTTGFPKAVILLGRGLTASLRAALAFNLVSRADVGYLAIPFNHQVTHLYLNGLLTFGGFAILSNRFHPVRTLETIARRRVTVFFGFPLTYTQMAAQRLQDYDLRSMRIWATTADASHEVHQRTFIRHGSFLKRLAIPVPGSVFVDGLGSSEVGVAALLRIAGPWTRTFGRRVGRPIPLLGPKVKIVDRDGRPVRRGEAGRLMVKGPSTFGGYWNAHDQFFGTTADGWWFTGDIVKRASDGSYVHLDREVDVIHHAEGTSYTLPMEEEILKHPAVYDATVFALAGGGRPPVRAAAIALNQTHVGLSADQLRAELNARLPAHDSLDVVQTRPWSAFPMGVTGKTLKRAFREGV